ncbi:hypothetical protein EDC04DRAFT_2017286 [Pisolithus marmoratus]|nr:hypothetical protein EDC04DRAFT_2017286 [Pisolithus marmoratus]
MLQSRLRDVQSEILTETGRRLGLLNGTADTIRDQIITTNQHVAELRQSVQAAQNDLVNAQQDINQHIAHVFIRSCQIHNAGCGLGFTRPFRIVPFVGADGVLQLPSAVGVGIAFSLTLPENSSHCTVTLPSCGPVQFDLPLLLNTRIISNLTNHQLDQYLERYGIEADSSRSKQLFQLREYIGYVPPDGFTWYEVAIFPLLFGGLVAHILYLCCGVSFKM